MLAERARVYPRPYWFEAAIRKIYNFLSLYMATLHAHRSLFCVPCLPDQNKVAGSSPIHILESKKPNAVAVHRFHLATCPQTPRNANPLPTSFPFTQPPILTQKPICILSSKSVPCWSFSRWSWSRSVNRSLLCAYYLLPS